MWEEIKINKKLTKEDVLKYISEEEIFLKYLGIYPEINKRYKNPLRENHTPNTEFTYNNGILYMKDWGWEQEERGMNCFEVIKKINNCTYEEALNIIYRDVVESNHPNISKIQKHNNPTVASIKQPLDIKIKVKQYSKEAIDFWSCNEEFIVTPKILRNYQIYECEYVWYNNKQIKCQELTFAYQISKGKFQIYIPFAKEKRWKFRTMELKNVIPFYHLCDRSVPVIVTKSYKDAYVLRRLGYNACCFLNEGTISDIEGIIIWLFDNDEKGIKTRNKCLELYKESTYLEIPKEYGKDCWEVVYNYGKNELIKLLEI